MNQRNHLSPFRVALSRPAIVPQGEFILTDPEAFADYDIDRGCIARLWCRRAGDSHAELARRAPAEDHAEAVDPLVSRLGISGRQLGGRDFAFA